MKFIKFLLALLAVGLGVWVIFWLFGLLTTVIWYVFWIAVIFGGAFGVYKIFLEGDGEPDQLEEKTPIAIAERDEAGKVLEEYRRKYLEK